MSNEPLIKLEKIFKTYQLGKTDIAVLKGLDLNIREGSFAVILGPSGSGKSTLLNIVGLLDTPDAGKVFFKGRDTSHLSGDDLAEIRGGSIGFVFQQFNLLSNLTALENVMIPMLFQDIEEKKRVARAENLLSSMGLAERLDHRPSEMSGGEQQRVAIARSLANQPDVIVADEPTGNLDSTTGKIIMEILIDLHKKEKKTIIVVTHDPTIADYGEETIRIKDGMLLKDHKHEEEVVWEEKK